jgi:hypothetical protein
MKMTTLSLNVLIVLMTISIPLIGQQNVGINTDNPLRSLQVNGSQDQYVRVHSTTNIGGEAGLELILGQPASPARDYKLTNDAGDFKLLTHTDNFETAGDLLWKINAQGEFGIGTSTPTSLLHIDNGEEASNTGDGYLIIGSKTGVNMVMDPDEINARNNGNINSLTLQSLGGHTYIGEGGGNAFFGATN